MEKAELATACSKIMSNKDRERYLKYLGCNGILNRYSNTIKIINDEIMFQKMQPYCDKKFIGFLKYKKKMLRGDSNGK